MLALSFSSMYFDPIQMGISPKAASTGGSFPTRPDGASSGYFNPALLDLFNVNQCRFSYLSNNDIKYINLAGLVQTPIGPLMLGVANIDVGDVPSTYLDSNGTVQRGPQIQNANTLITGATSFKLFKAPVGVALKIYTGGLDTNNAFGINANIGTYFTPAKNILISTYVVNALPLMNQVNWSSGRSEYLPTTFALGCTFYQHLYTLSLSTAYYDAFSEGVDHFIYNVGASVSLFGITLSGVVGKDTIQAKETYLAFGANMDFNVLGVGVSMIPSEMDSGSYVYYTDATLTFPNDSASKNITMPPPPLKTPVPILKPKSKK